MTRGFATKLHSATPVMLEYYRRRAELGVGLILTEGVLIDESADGYFGAPHLVTLEHVDSWKPVTAAVRAAGARFFCQLLHCGRLSHPDFTGGVAPVSSTSRVAEGINRYNQKPHGVPQPLDRGGMEFVVSYYIRAASHAIAAGFDGVELHFGHGYLVDQFLDGRINDRTDDFGGSVANRCRFALEIANAVAKRIGAPRVIVRISPSRDHGKPEASAISDWPDCDEMLAYLLPALWQIGVRTLDVSGARSEYTAASGRICRIVRPLWKGTLIGGASLTAAAAEAEVASGTLDLVTWGRALIANPDLVHKIRDGAPWIPFHPGMLKELR